MKMKNGLKKIKIIILFMMACLVFSAYNELLEDVPNLQNADDPFIELDSIGDSIGNAKTAYEAAHPTLTPTPTPEITPVVTPEPTPTEIPTNENEIKIIVGDENLAGSGESVILEGKKIRSLEELKSIITESDYDEKSILLIDYYAEKEALMEVKSTLDEIGISYRIETRDNYPTESIE